MATTKAIGILAKLVPLREKISALQEARIEVAGAPVSHDEARARVGEHVEAIARGVQDGHHPPQSKEEWFTRRHFMPGHQPQTSFSSIEQGLAIVAPDGLRAFLLQRLESVLVDMPEGIATPEREAQLEKMDAELFKLEVEEESVISEFEAVGLDVHRRGDASPAIILAIEPDAEEDPPLAA